MARSRKPTSWSACDGIHSELRPYRVSAIQGRCSPAPSPIAAWCRTRPCRTGRPMRGRCGSGAASISWCSRCAPARLINYVGFVPADAEMKESWTAKGDPDALRAEFAGWDPRIEARCWSKVESTFKWALHDREPLPTWTKGRLTLLGDAAHPMLPHLGQGANQSIEDGMALATILSRDRPRDAHRPRSSPTRRCAASASPACSAARARTACATTPCMAMSRSAMPRSPRMPRSARRSTTTTWWSVRRRAAEAL